MWAAAALCVVARGGSEPSFGRPGPEDVRVLIGSQRVATLLSPLRADCPGRTGAHI